MGGTKRKKENRSGTHQKKKTEQLEYKEQYIYNKIRWNNYQRLWLEQWYSAEKGKITNFYGCDANYLEIKEIKTHDGKKKMTEQTKQKNGQNTRTRTKKKHREKKEEQQ